MNVEDEELADLFKDDNHTPFLPFIKLTEVSVDPFKPLMQIYYHFKKLVRQKKRKFSRGHSVFFLLYHTIFNHYLTLSFFASNDEQCPQKPRNILLNITACTFKTSISTIAFPYVLYHCNYMSDWENQMWIFVSNVLRHICVNCHEDP